jgi:hypothetical protein
MKASPSSSPLLPELKALDLLRLDQDFTWQELARDMQRAGFQMSARTLHYLLTRAPETVKPLDRTLHKIRRYLEFARERDDARRARRSKAAPSPARA